MAIRHELSWSSARARSFEECRRAYYWSYYGSWRGWEAREGDPLREAWILKKLTRMPMFAGEVLHDALAWWFGERARGRTPAPAEVEAHALARLRAGYLESRDGGWKARPAKSTHLAEHQYSEDCIDEPSGRAAEYGGRYRDRIRAGVRAFFELEALAPAREADPASYLACEAMGTLTMFETKVFAVPDFAWRDAEGVRILDWKTGRPNPDDRFQLGLYALYAGAKWSVDPEGVRTADVYLSEGQVVEHVFDAADLDGIRARVERSLAAMRALHYDADHSDGDPERFPMLGESEAERVVCGRCNYRALCGR